MFSNSLFLLFPSVFLFFLYDSLFTILRIQSFLVDNLFLPEKLTVSEERKLRGNVSGCESGNGSGVWRDIGEFLDHQSTGNSVSFVSGVAYDENNDYGNIIDDSEVHLKTRNEELNGDNNNNNNNDNNSKGKSEEKREECNDNNLNENIFGKCNNSNNNNTTRKRTLEPADSSISNTETVQTVNIVKIVAHL